MTEIFRDGVGVSETAGEGEKGRKGMDVRLGMKKGEGGSVNGCGG